MAPSLVPDARREIRGEDGALLFRFRPDGVRRLGFLAREAMGRAGGPDREIGGLIIGYKTSHDAVETISAFVPVSIRYFAGSAFRPGPSDRDAFEAARSRYPSGGVSRVIGYFRSHLDGAPELRDDDRQMLHELFGDGDCCVALIEPGRFPETIQLYARRDRALELVSETPVEATQETAQRTEHEAAPQADRGVPRWRPIPPKTAGAVIAALGLFALGYFAAPGKRAAETIAPGFSIEGRGRQVELKWNPSSPVVKNAVRGSIVIVDDTDASRVELGSQQLRAGSYEYTPRRGNLTFQISFYDHDSNFTGETRAFHMKMPAPAVVEDAVAAPEPRPARYVKASSPDEEPIEIVHASEPAQPPAETAQSQTADVPAAPAPAAAR